MASGNGNRTNAMAQNGVNAGTASSAVNFVNPIYQTMAEGDVGYTPQQRADMQTAISQGAGGGAGAAVGQAGLLAARTGNAGGADVAVDDAAQAAARVQANAGLQVNTQNAQLEQQNRIAGLDGINDIYKTATGAAVGDLNAANGAGNSFWKQWLLNAQSGAAQAASGNLGG